MFILHAKEARDRLDKIGETIRDGGELEEEELTWLFDTCCCLLAVILLGEYRVLPMGSDLEQ